MKVKKVEISAFRIYDDPKDATFDLTTKSGTAASFVSLYAPNGFGKTSFYDAVEYGVTESVDRFYMRVDELEKMANVQSIDKFIRNTNSDRNTYVKIYTDANNDEPTYNRQFYKHGNQKHDLILDSRRRKEHSFQKVILSQEWISAFLTESDGETRYRKFMSNPELSDLDNYYNNLRFLLKALDNKKNLLKKPIEDLKKIIQNVSTENTLEKVNNQIQLLRDNFNENVLEPLSLEATQEQAQRLQDTIADLLISQNKESSLRQLLDHVAIAKSGNDIVLGINLYYILNEDRSKGAVRLATLMQLLQKFEDLEQQQIAVENKRNSQADYIAIKDNIEKVLKNFEEYSRVHTEISNKEEEKKNKDKDLHDFQAQNEISTRNLIENKSQLDSIVKQIEENTRRKTSAPTIKQRLEKLDAEITKFNNDLTEKRTELETKTNELRTAKESSSQYERILLEIEKGLYPQIASGEKPELLNLIQKIQSTEAELLSKRQELKLVETSIAEHQNLNQTITDFIKVGLTIVNERKSTSCPLCDQIYDSYEDLVDQITSNKALDDTVKALLEQKNIIDTNIISISGQVTSYRATLSSQYKFQFDKIAVQVKLLESSLREINIAIESTERTLESLKLDRESLFSSIGGISLNEYIASLDKNISDLTNKRNNINSAIDKDQGAHNDTVAKIDSIHKQIILLSDEISNLVQSEQYTLVANWFKENAASEIISKNKIIEEEEAYSKRISVIADEIKQAENIINNLKKELDAYTKDSLNHERTELQKSDEEITSRVERYKNYIKDNLKIDVSGLNKSSLSDLLDEEQKKISSELNINKQLLDEYQKLNSYSQNIWAFLQSENARKKAEDAQTELDFLETKVELQIRSEFNSAKEYLETKVKNFFHVNLINDIYKKIDPHPDFKSVEFKASFEGETPRLDVFVRKINDDTVLVPNLYFSTAQINILSLSIFLASALKETEYKCIFIDDPIQSMDNINVLSTIDLLRSIVVNEDRQIILSTHDENFHNLLKKKMPSELFESKFLELESFGRVKVN